MISSFRFEIIEDGGGAELNGSLRGNLYWATCGVNTCAHPGYVILVPFDFRLHFPSI